MAQSASLLTERMLYPWAIGLLEDTLGRYEEKYKITVTPRDILTNDDLLDRICDELRYGPFCRDDIVSWARHLEAQAQDVVAGCLPSGGPAPFFG